MLKHLNKDHFVIEQSNDALRGFSIFVRINITFLMSYLSCRLIYKKLQLSQVWSTRRFWATHLRFWCRISILSEIHKFCATLCSRTLWSALPTRETCLGRLLAKVAGKLAISCTRWFSSFLSLFKKCTWWKKNFIRSANFILVKFRISIPLLLCQVSGQWRRLNARSKLMILGKIFKKDNLSWHPVQFFCFNQLRRTLGTESLLHGLVYSQSSAYAKIQACRSFSPSFSNRWKGINHGY